MVKSQFFRLIGICILTIVFSIHSNLDAKAQSDQENVLLVVQNVFDGINTKNGPLIESVMAKGSVLYSTGVNDKGPFFNPQTGIQFAGSIASATSEFHEHMFETEVKIQQGVAMVWANYDFHVNGNFSHCGVDTFTLVRSVDGWKVASLVYTVERSGCKERSPIPSK